MSPLDPELSKIEMQNSITMFKENMIYFFEMQKIQANLLRNFFNELVVKGFDEDQAMQIIETHGYLCTGKGNGDTDKKGWEED